MEMAVVDHHITPIPTPPTPPFVPAPAPTIVVTTSPACQQSSSLQPTLPRINSNPTILSLMTTGEMEPQPTTTVAAAAAAAATTTPSPAVIMHMHEDHKPHNAAVHKVSHS
jgi:hypothetical protein